MYARIAVFVVQNRKPIGKAILITLIAVLALFFFFFSSLTSDKTKTDVEIGEFTSSLPSFPEIKGTGNIPDEIAQLAVGTGVKYRLLPSVVLSQWAYESEWGRSLSAKNDNNYFGITWFDGAPFPRGTARGVGGSEGGWYMKFPDKKNAFSYYGYMLSKQSNFNASVGNKDPGSVLLILGRGGYAAAGITILSPYYQGCISIINANKLVDKYDSFAINKWKSIVPSVGGKGRLEVLDAVLGQSINGGQCYGGTAYYVQKMGGPQLMGSGNMYASRIGTDYDWKKYGWEVILNPKYSDLKAGDVINWNQDPNFATAKWGHTGIIKSVSGKNQSFVTYEQNSSKGEIVAIYERTWIPSISSVVRKK